MKKVLLIFGLMVMAVIAIIAYKMNHDTAYVRQENFNKINNSGSNSINNNLPPQTNDPDVSMTNQAPTLVTATDNPVDDITTSITQELGEEIEASGELEADSLSFDGEDSEINNLDSFYEPGQF